MRAVLLLAIFLNQASVDFSLSGERLAGSAARNLTVSMVAVPRAERQGLSELLGLSAWYGRYKATRDAWQPASLCERDVHGRIDRKNKCGRVGQLQLGQYDCLSQKPDSGGAGLNKATGLLGRPPSPPLMLALAVNGLPFCEYEYVLYYS